MRPSLPSLVDLDADDLADEHNYQLSSKEKKILRLEAKKSPCAVRTFSPSQSPALTLFDEQDALKGKSCPNPESCIGGHQCPWGAKCGYGATCRFTHPSMQSVSLSNLHFQKLILRAVHRNLLPSPLVGRGSRLRARRMRAMITRPTRARMSEGMVRTFFGCIFSVCFRIGAAWTD